MKEMNLKHKAFHLLVTGRSSTGKTTFLENIIRDESKHDRVMIYDPEFEFVTRFSEKECSICRTLEDMGNENNKRIRIYVPPEDSDNKQEFDDFYFYAWHFGTNCPGTLLLVTDELQEFVDSDTFPEFFRKCITKGRRYEIDMAYISQAPNLLHNAIRTQTTDAVAFAQSDELPVKFNRMLGFDGDVIMNLADLHYLHKRRGFPPEPGKLEFKKK